MTDILDHKKGRAKLAADALAFMSDRELLNIVLSSPDEFDDITVELAHRLAVTLDFAEADPD